MELQYNKRDVKISFVLIVLVWLVGQFVFLWVYQTFGDVTYQRNYAEIFNDPTVAMVNHLFNLHYRTYS